MELFFSPLACSLASRISLYEAGATARFTQVDAKTKRTIASTQDSSSEGQDYRLVNPLGLVPALRLDDGTVLTENAAVLQWLADQHPQAHLAPVGGLARAQLQQWLSFIGTELHKATFFVLFDKALPDSQRAKTLVDGAERMAVLQAHLTGRDHLLDSWSVADAYLTTVLNWHRATGVDLTRWPAVLAYFERMCARPATARALQEELALYLAEQRRA